MLRTGSFLPPPLLLVLLAVWCADLDVGDACDGEHAADEEARQDVVVVQVLAQPHLDLRQEKRKPAERPCL